MKDGTRHEAAHILLATGSEDLPPPLSLPDREEAVGRGRLRFCPICDAYEVTGRKIALASTRRCRIQEALLLRGYTADLSLITLQVALGLRARSDLAVALGADHDADGALAVDQHQMTTVPGLYAAGDVVQGLAQISVAMGQAAIAATAIHNSLPPLRAC